MSRFSTIDIVSGSHAVISAKYGAEKASRFLDLITIANVNVSGVDDIAQVSMINKFWRNELIKYPNTTNIRAWLSENCSIEAYLNSFDNHWLKLVVEVGAL